MAAGAPVLAVQNRGGRYPPAADESGASPARTPDV